MNTTDRPTDEGAKGLGGILNSLALAIDKMPENKAERPPEDEFALIAIVKACYKTRKYLAVLKQNGRRLSTEEMEIAKSWRTAASMLGNYDSTLATRLNSKAGYWQEEETWSSEAVDEAQTSLDAIDRSVQSKENR
jgi:hypothetical protein